MKINTKLSKLLQIKDKELLYLLKGRPGGKTSIRIIDELLKEPHNRNQLSKELKLDYKTINYHLDIICKYDYIVKEKFEKHYYYRATEKLYNNLEEYIILKESFKK